MKLTQVQSLFLESAEALEDLFQLKACKFLIYVFCNLTFTPILKDLDKKS